MNPSVVQIVKINSIILIFIVLSFGLKAQGCLPEGITFTTQEQIDSFPVDYPGCTEIEGNVDIINGQITNLLGLSNITAIGGRLTIGLIEELTTLSGLDNLTTIGDYLSIEINENLINVNGLNQLVTIGGNMTFYGNPGIVNFEGLNNLNSIGADFYVEWNENLQNFTGLEGLDSIGGRLYFFSNQFLSNLNGLDNLRHIGGDISIQYNTSLSDIQGLSYLEQGTISNLNISSNPVLHDCEILPFCEFLSNPIGSVNIYSNGAGCNNPSEVAESCGFELGCLPYGNYWVVNQQEADNFFQNYPGCSDLKGDLHIGGDILNYVNGLYGINSIEGDLLIQRNHSMNNLIGLESLTTIGGDLYIGGWEEGNLYLRNLTGLENLVNFDGNIQVINNEFLENLHGLSGIDSVFDLTLVYGDKLIDLSGLDSLKTIQNSLYIGGNNLKHLYGLERIDSIAGDLSIGQNDSLIDLDGLNNLQFIGNSFYLTHNKLLTDLTHLTKLRNAGRIFIWNNDILQNLSGLDRIQVQNIDYLSIEDNNMLSQCETENICDYLIGLDGTAVISNNAPGCNTREEVEAACTVGQNELKQSDFCRIHPNPTSGLLRFSFLLSEPSKVRIEIVNSFGQKIPSPKPDFLSYGHHEIIWNAGQLPKGIYYYRIQTDSQTSNGRIILTD